MTHIKDAGGEPESPPIDGLERIWMAWIEAGVASGGAALRWSEIEAYGRITGLHRDEMTMLRTMSDAYVDGLSLTSPLAIAPMESYS